MCGEINQLDMVDQYHIAKVFICKILYVTSVFGNVFIDLWTPTIMPRRLFLFQTIFIVNEL